MQTFLFVVRKIVINAMKYINFNNNFKKILELDFKNKSNIAW